jgi:hypothetical protein
MPDFSEVSWRNVLCPLMDRDKVPQRPRVQHCIIVAVLFMNIVPWIIVSGLSQQYWDATSIYNRGQWPRGLCNFTSVYNAAPDGTPVKRVSYLMDVACSCGAQTPVDWPPMIQFRGVRILGNWSVTLSQGDLLTAANYSTDPTLWNQLRSNTVTACWYAPECIVNATGCTPDRIYLIPPIIPGGAGGAMAGAFFVSVLFGIPGIWLLLYTRPVFREVFNNDLAGLKALEKKRRVTTRK